MLRDGGIHAELTRVAAYNNKVPTAIKVEEPITSLPYHAYTLSKDIVIDGWDSLRSYKIVHVRGHIFIEPYLKNHSTFAVNSAKTAFLFLKAERADLYIEEILTANPILNSPELAGSGINRIDPPLAILNTYTFFSSKFPDYAKQYHKSLVEIKKEGIYKKIFLETK